ncbi:unnamed protein product [Ilex paraguariensis]|uniref:Uncharacterized protein n=1 Tax=Ilex paraguariensis TaxID=185542 RepID=A0ABC8TF97_9AQUA
MVPPVVAIYMKNLHLIRMHVSKYFVILLECTKGSSLSPCRVCLQQDAQATTVSALHQQHMKELYEILGQPKHHPLCISLFCTAPPVFPNRYQLFYNDQSITEFYIELAKHNTH